MPATWILLFVILSVAGLALQITLLCRLQRRHREVWIRMDEPMTLWNYGPRQHRALTAFYWSAEHRKLDDPFLTTLLLASRVLTVPYVFLILFAAWLAFTGG